MNRHFILVTRNTTDYNIAYRQALFKRPTHFIYNLVLPISDALPARKLLNSSDVDGIDTRAVVGQQCSERSSDDFRPIDYGDCVSEQAITKWQDRVVYS